MQRIRNTIEIAKASWQVLLADKELMLLPIMSSVASLSIAATFLLPVAVFTNGDGPVPIIVGVITYFVLTFIVIYFNTALIGAAHERLTGGDPTLSSALAEANRHLPSILGWAAISATVSAILKAIEERAGFIGALVAGVVGLAWTLVTFLVIPIYVIEGVGVVDAIKRSSELFKRTWGENMAANIGFGILAFLAMLPLLALAVGGVATGNSVVAGVGIGVAVLGGVLVSIVMATLSGIFQTALYLYATSGQTPAAFAGTDLSGAFRPRRGRRR